MRPANLHGFLVGVTLCISHGLDMTLVLLWFKFPSIFLALWSSQMWPLFKLHSCQWCSPKVPSAGNLVIFAPFHHFSFCTDNLYRSHHLFKAGVGCISRGCDMVLVFNVQAPSNPYWQPPRALFMQIPRLWTYYVTYFDAQVLSQVNCILGPSECTHIPILYHEWVVYF